MCGASLREHFFRGIGHEQLFSGDAEAPAPVLRVDVARMCLQPGDVPVGALASGSRASKLSRICDLLHYQPVSHRNLAVHHFTFSRTTLWWPPSAASLLAVSTSIIMGLCTVQTSMDDPGTARRVSDLRPTAVNAILAEVRQLQA